ncbi:hypothetical protein DLAC_09613 [Tieghemostelium lacteum]|uniref:EGF-like domain-containing protein n=1 Tax=Tieghemostelium lacteum TaxID=361077 RepID=A0A151Z6U0_TIELA|nr:hypothetical protein DLAC_09613 [Tieghemostelium lacteum]|eukprot:KYQ89647.1 hypothetical protein DLAC_09613 [Tieghemostelium lacteum]
MCRLKGLILCYLIICIFSIECQLPTSQNDALTAISNAFSLGWTQPYCDITSSITCSGNKVVALKIVYTIIPTYVPAQEFLSLPNLREIEFGSGIGVNDEFWDVLQSLTVLESLIIQDHQESLPNDLGKSFPSSLTNFQLKSCQNAIPSTLFTKTKIQTLGISLIELGSFPGNIDLPSQVTQFSATVRDSFIDGAFFDQLRELSLTPTDSIQFKYDRFSTFTTSQLSIKFLDSIRTSGLYSFPGSIYMATNINTLSIGDGWFNFQDAVLNFTAIPQLSLTITDSNINTVQNILFGVGISLQIDASIGNLNFMNIFQNANQMLNLDSCELTEIPENGAYENILLLNIKDNQVHTISDDFCKVRSFDISDNGVTSAPQCIICSKNTFPTRILTGNTMISSMICNQASITLTLPTNIKVPTRGGSFTITGNNMGWRIYKNTNEIWDSDAVIPNQQYALKLDPGVGIDIPFTIRLYADEIHKSDYPGTFSYLPPSIGSNQVITSTGSWVLRGSNFGNQTTNCEVTIASSAYSVGLIFEHDTITFPMSPLPYNQDIIFKVWVNIAGQQVVKIIDKLIGEPILYQPFPQLDNGTGPYHVTFYGDHLTFDHTIVSLKLGTLSCQVISSTLTSVTCSYSNIQNTKDLSVELNIASHIFKGAYVTPSPCVPVPNGYCQGNLLVCNQGFTGPNCTLQIIIVPPPSVNNTSPSTNTTDTTTLPDGTKVTHTSLISIVEIKEIKSINNETIHKYLFDTWHYLNISENHYQYTSNFTSLDKQQTGIKVDIHWYDTPTNITFGSQIIQVQASTLKYNIILDKYNFQSPINSLQLIMSAKFQVSDESDESCSLIEFGEENQNYDYFRMQYNNIGLYGKFIRLALVDNRTTQISNTILSTNDMNDNDDSTYESLISINVPHYYQNLFLDPDFSLLIDSENANTNPNANCKSNAKSGLTRIQKIGIIIGCSVFGVCLIIVSLFILYKHNITFKVQVQKVIKMKQNNIL